jgi:hypothetical protein
MADILCQERSMADGDGDLEVPWGLLLGILDNTPRVAAEFFSNLKSYNSYIYDL